MRNCVSIVMLNDRQELLLQFRDDGAEVQNPHKWCFFGGGIEDGELPLICAVREIFEELGYHAEVQDFDYRGSLRSRTKVKHHVVFLRAPVSWGDVHVFEGAGAGFFRPSSALSLRLTSGTRRIINTYFK